MRGTKRFELKLVAMVLAMLLGSCNPTSLDNGSSADSIFEVFNIPTVPPVTSALDPVNGCTFTVTSMTVSLRNQGKSALAGETAFNDIIVDNVTLTYTWDHPELGLVTPTRTLSLGGTVPAGGTGTVSFPPLALGDLQLAYGGHSVNIAMLFHGHTVAGKAVSATGGAVLGVNSCVASADCTPGTDDDGDGIVCPNDACPNCDDTSCSQSTCGTAAVTCNNPNASCEQAFEPNCVAGSDTDSDGLSCPNDKCPRCDDTACTGNAAGGTHPCNVSTCTGGAAQCP